jgi:hypothetical protein
MYSQLTDSARLIEVLRNNLGDHESLRPGQHEPNRLVLLQIENSHIIADVEWERQGLEQSQKRHRWDATGTVHLTNAANTQLAKQTLIDVEKRVLDYTD